MDDVVGWPGRIRRRKIDYVRSVVGVRFKLSVYSIPIINNRNT